MSTYEQFTSDEIVSILQEMEIDVRFESQAENEFGLTSLECEVGPINFWCWLTTDEPFFEGMSLYSSRFEDDNPLAYVNGFNNVKHVSRAGVATDDEGLIVLDEDGDAIVTVRAEILFAGGVTKAHVRYLLFLWLEDLVDFHELELSEEAASESEAHGLETNESGKNVVADEEPLKSNDGLQSGPLVEMIVACLSAGPAKTAREIKDALGSDRHLINRVLYKHRDTFQKTSSQPPLWSLKN